MRDNFSKSIVKSLGMRVAYRCSNPECDLPTIAASTEKDKAVIIGIAAHVTAASPGGKRYDNAITPQKRADSDNGIWLCQNCAKIIDSDDSQYTVEVLLEWKKLAEEKAREAIKSSQKKVIAARPFAEPSLIWRSSMRWQEGISMKNIELQAERNGEALHPFEVIRIYNIAWNYILKISNNSDSNLYNLGIYWPIEAGPIFTIERIPKRQNLASLADYSTEAEVKFIFEGTGKEAEKFQHPFYPASVQGLRFLLEYDGEDRSKWYSECVFEEDDFKITHLDKRPDGYE